MKKLNLYTFVLMLLFLLVSQTAFSSVGDSLWVFLEKSSFLGKKENYISDVLSDKVEMYSCKSYEYDYKITHKFNEIFYQKEAFVLNLYFRDSLLVGINLLEEDPFNPFLPTHQFGYLLDSTLNDKLHNEFSKIGFSKVDLLDSRSRFLDLNTFGIYLNSTHNERYKDFLLKIFQSDTISLTKDFRSMNPTSKLYGYLGLLILNDKKWIRNEETVYLEYLLKKNIEVNIQYMNQKIEKEKLSKVVTDLSENYNNYKKDILSSELYKSISR